MHIIYIYIQMFKTPTHWSNALEKSQCDDSTQGRSVHFFFRNHIYVKLLVLLMVFLKRYRTYFIVIYFSWMEKREMFRAQHTHCAIDRFLLPEHNLRGICVCGTRHLKMFVYHGGRRRVRGRAVGMLGWRLLLWWLHLTSITTAVRRIEMNTPSLVRWW